MCEAMFENTANRKKGNYFKTLKYKLLMKYFKAIEKRYFLQLKTFY